MVSVGFAQANSAAEVKIEGGAKKRRRVEGGVLKQGCGA